MNTSLLQIPQFNNKPIRSVIHEGKVYWSIVDIIESIYGVGRGNYNWSKVKRNEFDQVLPFWQQLKLTAVDGKMYQTDCAIEEDIYRILQSVPSPKVEEFKQWLAKVAKERLEEEQNPQLAVDRAVRTWQKQGKPEDWIAQRLKTVGVRNNITATWKAHGIQGDEYGILTDDLHKGVFNKKVKEHKKELAVNGSIRDHLSRIELIAIEAAEAMAEELTKHRNSQGLAKIKQDVKDGSAIGADALNKYKKLLSEQ